MKFPSKWSALVAYIRAACAYLRALLGPADAVDSSCSRGHTLLKDWEHCPHCKVINRLETLQRQRKLRDAKAPKLALYGLSGANKGQTILVTEERNTLGCTAGTDIVLTPESLNTQGNYQILVNGKVKLTSSDTHYFKLNGQAGQSATLLDFDELELLDNRFLVLDLRPSNGGAHGS